MQYVIKRIKNSILPTICLSFVLAYSPDVSSLALVCLTYKKTKKKMETGKQSWKTKGNNFININ